MNTSREKPHFHLRLIIVRIPIEPIWNVFNGFDIFEYFCNLSLMDYCILNALNKEDGGWAIVLNVNLFKFEL